MKPGTGSGGSTAHNMSTHGGFPNGMLAQGKTQQLDQQVEDGGSLRKASCSQMVSKR
jgi:hypothetical protein